jgi:hypothetical protein
LRIALTKQLKMKTIDVIYVATAFAFFLTTDAVVVMKQTAARKSLGSSRPKPRSNNVVVGYYVSCNVNNPAKDIAKHQVGDGLLVGDIDQLSRTFPEMECKPQQEPQICQLKTHEKIWKHLAKIQNDLKKNTPTTKKTYVTYGYDASPVIYEDKWRFIPSHLLRKSKRYIGATYLDKARGVIMHIGEDGGIRYVRESLFSANCKSSLDLTPFAYSWHDPGHESFRKTSELAERRIVAVGDLHGDMKSTYEVLQMAGVIDKDNNWAGGANTVFVQTVGRPLPSM